MTKIFISWTGNLGKEIAEFLHGNLLSYRELEPWISSQDIGLGEPWFQETEEALATSEYGIVCLTPGASKRPWINFEIGWLYGKLRQCQLITFNETLSNPLANLQKANGLDRQTWFNVLKQMSKSRDREVDSWLNDQFPKLEAIFRLSNSSPYKFYCNLDKQFSEIHDAMDTLRKNTFLRDNTLFQNIISKSYRDLIDYSNQLKSTYSIPASEYPRYLVYLQEQYNLFVRAIAIIGGEEVFWKSSMGITIKKTSSPENERIFVFSSPSSFEAYYHIIKDHARKYKVYAISLSRLSDILGDNYARDFSILENNNSLIVAMYERGQSVPENHISFASDEKSIEEYSRVYDNLKQSSFLIPITGSKMGEDEIKDLSKQIFSGITPYERKPVEMSVYINVDEYDAHEENHAYYQEMRQRMIEICKTHSLKQSKKSLRLLEFGAGTGLFTMELADKIDNLKQLDAIEFDWHCYHVLQGKKRSLHLTRPELELKMKIYHEDSRTYDPEGKFDYIFSAFADHHIKKADKEIYFQNVKKNLKSNALMIVGDEFLRDYDLDSRDDKDQALRDYHDHIINIAKGDGYEILAMLEQQALVSGLNEKGDFKVSCRQYEDFLHSAGFHFKKEKIGPLDKDDIGGVYVYIAALDSDSLECF